MAVPNEDQEMLLTEVIMVLSRFLKKLANVPTRLRGLNAFAKPATISLPSPSATFEGDAIIKIDLPHSKNAFFILVKNSLNVFVR